MYDEKLEKLEIEVQRLRANAAFAEVRILRIINDRCVTGGTLGTLIELAEKLRKKGS